MMNKAVEWASSREPALFIAGRGISRANALTTHRKQIAPHVPGAPSLRGLCAGWDSTDPNLRRDRNHWTGGPAFLCRLSFPFRNCGRGFESPGNKAVEWASSREPALFIAGRGISRANALTTHRKQIAPHVPGAPSLRGLCAGWDSTDPNLRHDRNHWTGGPAFLCRLSFPFRNCGRGFESPGHPPGMRRIKRWSGRHPESPRSSSRAEGSPAQTH